MDVLLLIDQIVRQTTVLIAQLATTSGVRAPLSHVAGQVFFDLTRELRSQGLGNKVIADMFGLALRTYRERVRRLAESSTDRGTTLWEAVLKYVQQTRTTTRADVLRRFAADDPQSVRAVLSDLVKNGVLYRSGRGDTTNYRAAEPEERSLSTARADQALLDAAWVLLHQQGSASAAAMAQLLRIDEVQATDLLHQLVHVGRARTQTADGDHPPHFIADHCVIPVGASAGWEAALLDHFQAVVTTMINKVSNKSHGSRRGATTGGSTYHFDLYPGHPHEQEILALLTTYRSALSDLRTKARAYPPPLSDGYRVVFYAGQDVRELSSETDTENKP